jgi:quinol monooxygenase YgiN
MAIGVTATLKVQEGKNEKFVEIFKQLTDAVKANENGCLFYACHQSRDDAQVYIVLEQYSDETALQAHSKTEYYHRLGNELASTLSAAPAIVVMDSI